MIKRVAYLALIVCVLAALSVRAASPRETDYSFHLARPAEVILTLDASAPGTSWAHPGAEAAVLRVALDGRYNQHVTLVCGAERHRYERLLGPLPAGNHRVRVVLDRRLSSPAARSFSADVATRAIEPGAPEYDAIRYAPILYARPDTVGHATDTPLLAYYEWLPPSEDAPAGSTRMLQYTCIFSNEDAGTNTPQLMARWGRSTDIEHVYRMFFDARSKETGVIYQAVEHEELPFRGERLGAHLLVGVESKNNNFSDQRTSAVRIALVPEQLDLSGHSREEEMDRHPWSYRIMAQEMEREGKLEEIGDQREYLYLEASVKTSTSSVAFGVVLNDGRTFRSDADRVDRRVERSGWVRSTIHLPKGAALSDVKDFVFYCELPGKENAHVTEHSCSITAVSKLFMLDRDFQPGAALSTTRNLPHSIAAGQSVVIPIR